MTTMHHQKNISLLLSTIFLFFIHYASAQRSGVEDDIIKTPAITSDAQIFALTPDKKQTTISYFDGMSRVIQSIAVQASPLQHDIIQPTVYDNLGRQTINYLPYADENANLAGSYRPDADSTGQPAFYNNSTQYLIPKDNAPYNQQVFENSPLQRLMQTGLVGSGFQPGVAGNHIKTAAYRPNSATADGNILQWNVNGTYTAGSFYANNTLSVTDGKDEDNIEALSFTDFAGHVVLKRQILSSGNFDTYYIYNNAGMLSYTIPPNATALLSINSYNLTIAPLSNIIFKFVYDQNGRLVQKTVPGKGVVYIVYDPVNRPVLLQDANMRVNKNWNYIKYDGEGRAISQGIYNDTGHLTLAAMQSYVNTLSYSTWYESRTNSGSNANYYTDIVFPTTGTPLAFAYYDDYNMTEGASPNFVYASQGLSGEVGATGAPVKGMPTVVSKTTIGSGLTNTWLTNVVFYDKRGNVIQTQSNNQLNYTGATTLTDIKTSVPDFIGVPQIGLVSKVTGSGSTNTIKVQTNLTYDAMNRLSVVSQKYNTGATTVVAVYTYNEIGQLIQKGLGQIATGIVPSTLNLNMAYGGTNTLIATNSITMSPGFSVPLGATFKAFISTGYLQTVDMRYNIRGQLLSINNSKLSNDGGQTNADNTDLFGMQFSYDQVDANIGNIASFDGKMTAVKWMSTDASGNRGYERSYKYAYDGINRYTAASYAERTQASTSTFNINIGGFDEYAIQYDVNGGSSIMALKRNSSTLGASSHIEIDNLSYGYDGTNPYQLLTVSDVPDANHRAAGFRNITGTTDPNAKYTYDVNGNLTADPYKGITNISYNFLNRTDQLMLSSTQYINYTYDADGNLIRKQAYKSGSTTQITDYIDGFEYDNAGGAESLSYFPMPEGRVVNVAGTLKQEFIITDQQGNARLSFQDNGSGQPVVKQENSYYGFGLIMPNSAVATPTPPNKQLYNGGSEWQNDYTDTNLPDYYQTLNRNYDAAIGRFAGVDPQAEGAEGMTSYQYAGNNPIMYNDPLGNQRDYTGYSDLQIQLINSRGAGPHHVKLPGDEPDYGMSDDQLLLQQAQGGDLAALQEYGNRYGTPGDLSLICDFCGMSYNKYADGTIAKQPNGLQENFYDIAISNTQDGDTKTTDANISFEDWQKLTGGDSNSDSEEGDEPAYGATVTTTFTDYKTGFSNGIIDTKIEAYHGTVIGREGKFGTGNINITPHSVGSDTDYRLGFLGVGMSNEEVSISFNFGKSSYKFGISETEGAFEDDSYTNKGLINGTRFNYKANPSGAAIVGALSAAGTYIYSTLSNFETQFQ